MQDIAALEEDNKNYGDIRLQGSEQSILAMGIVGLGKETMAENSVIIESAVIWWSCRYTDTCLLNQEQKFSSRPNLIVCCGSFYIPALRIGSGTTCDCWWRASVPPVVRGWRRQSKTKRLVCVYNVCLCKQWHINSMNK